MTSRTPYGHFTSLARHCRDAARYHDMARLQQYLASPKFMDALNAQGPLMRKIAIRVMTESVAVCASKAPARKPAVQRVNTPWHEVRIAKLRKALFRGGFEAAAAELGVTTRAARLAAKRHVPDYVAPAIRETRRAA